MHSLREPDETLYDLLRASEGEEVGIDWSRFAFDIEFLRTIPSVPGTYRFYNADGDLLYVGKSNNLHARVGSYFRTGGPRSTRVDGILQSLHRIEIGAEVVGGETVCWVRDNGIGIEAAYHETVFGLFQQLDQSRGGTGIGLALVRRILEVHGGRVWVDSEGPGKGTCASFTIPDSA